MRESSFAPFTPEIKQPENLEENKENTESGSDGIKSKIKAAAKIAAMFALFNLPFSSQAQEGNESEAKQYTIEETRVNLKDVKLIVENNKDFKTRKINDQEVESHVFSPGNEVICSKDAGYVIISSDYGKRTMVDINSDGVIDRLLINKEITDTDDNDKKNGQKRMGNLAHVFTPLKEDAQNAKFRSDLEKTKRKMDSIFNVGGSGATKSGKEIGLSKMSMIDLYQEKSKVNMLDGETAKIYELSGEEADKLIKECQALYAQTLDNFSKQGK